MQVECILSTYDGPGTKGLKWTKSLMPSATLWRIYYFRGEGAEAQGGWVASQGLTAPAYAGEIRDREGSGSSSILQVCCWIVPLHISRGCRWLLQGMFWGKSGPGCRSLCWWSREAELWAILALWLRCLDLGQAAFGGQRHWPSLLSVFHSVGVCSLAPLTPPPPRLLPQVLIVNGESLRGCAYWVAVSIKINTCSSLSKIRARQVLALVGQGQAQCLSVPCPERDQMKLVFSSCPFLSCLGWRLESGNPQPCHWSGLPHCCLGAFQFSEALGRLGLHSMVGLFGIFNLRPCRYPINLQDRVGKEAQWVDCHHLSLIFTRHVQYEPQTQKTINHVLCLRESDLTWKTLSSPGKFGYNEIPLGGLHWWSSG